MHIVYSAINTNLTSRHLHDNGHAQTQNEIAVRYKAYQDTCDKYRHEIAAIQKYIPGWIPKFR